MVARGWGWRERLTIKEREGNLGGDQTIPYLDCGGGGFMITCTRQDSKKCTLKEG